MCVGPYTRSRPIDSYDQYDLAIFVRERWFPNNDLPVVKFIGHGIHDLTEMEPRCVNQLWQLSHIGLKKVTAVKKRLSEVTAVKKLRSKAKTI